MIYSGWLIYLQSFIVSLMLLGSLDAFSQNLKVDFDEYSVSQGLSHNQVLAIAQDKRGFMWFGTVNGLNRFDGYNFKQYKYASTDSSTVISNEIRTLLALDDGSLLIGTNLGVCRYLPETDNFFRYEINYTDNSKLHGNYVTSMQTRNDRSIWITYLGSGVDVIYPDSSFVLHFTMYRDDRYILKNDMLTSLEFMPDGMVLLGGQDGFQVISDKMEVLTESQLGAIYPWSSKLPRSWTSLLLLKDNKTLWVGTESLGLFKVDISTGSVNQFNTRNSELDSDFIECIYESSDQLWFGSSAPFTYDADRNNIKWFNKKGMFFKNRIKVFFEDNGKNLWMGTTRVGVRKINYDEGEIVHFHSNQGEGSIKSDEVLAFHEDHNKNIWISLGGVGLYKFENDDGNYSFTDSRINGKLASQSVKTIYEDEHHILWLGSWEGGLSRFDPISLEISGFNPGLKNFPSQHVWDIEKAEGDKIWVATLRDGLCLFSTSTKEFQYFRHVETDSASLINNDVLCLQKDDNGNLWIGTGNGLSIKSPDETVFQNYFLMGTPLMANLVSNVVHCMYRDTSGKIWLGTNGSGLIIASLKGANVVVEKIVTDKEGLISNVIHSFQSNGNGRVWITTNNGISIMNESTLTLEKTNDNQLLKGTEFLANSTCLTSDGKILLGSTTGFYEINSNEKKINLTKPPVYIVELRLLNRTATPGDQFNILSKSIELTKEITIPNDINYYSFEFAALNYSQSDRNQYAYKLDGFDNDWNQIGTKRSASFTKLSPGAYTLRVKASNNDNLWNDEGTSLVINILPPWYQTFWFRSLIFFSTISTVILIVRIRTSTIRSNNKKLESLVALRTSELSMTNTELQTSKEEIAAQNEELREKTEEIASQRDFVENQNRNILLKSKQLEDSHQKLQHQNKELERLHEEKDGMINIIAHDLKSPLKQIQGLTDLIRMSGEVNENQEKYLSLIRNVVSHGSSLINNLLELHGFDNENNTQEFSSVNLKDFIPVWLQGYQSNLNAKKQKINLNVQEGLGTVTVNWDYLQRVMDNLLTNAMKFSYERTTIEINVSHTTDRLQFSVKDEGQGISDADQKELFKPFKKLSPRPTGGESSTGLGLSIVKLLVEKMGGNLEVSSKPGRGSTFTVNLPLNHS